ncbi:MAG TPA: ABC transporter substrate-binding protein [Candidatus Binatia bacterium]|nr:ABC transporter substrate-binding protein [Candidatus Binatia bacterium]
MKRRRAITLILFILLILLVGAPSTVQAQLARITVTYAGESPTHLPAWVAADAGIFLKNGLDAQLIRARSDISIMALLSGEVSFAQTGATSVINSRLGGSDAVIVAGGTVSLPYWLVSQPGIKSPDQLKGKTVGVLAIGGTAYVVARFALRKLGLDPDKDVAMLAVGGTPERLLALRTGRIQATLLSPPTVFAAKREGLNILADVAALGLNYQHDSVVTTEKFIRENRDTVAKYVKSQIEAVHFAKTNRDAGLKILARYLRQLKDKESLEQSYDISVADHMLPRKQYPSRAGIQTILEELAGRNPRAKQAKPEEFIDTRFVQQLDESGYIDQLYARK